MGAETDANLRAYGLVTVATFAYTCLTFVWFSLPVYLTTIIEETGLTSTQAGLLVGAIPLSYIPLSLLSGIVVDRVGPGRCLAAGVLIYGVAQIGRSIALDFSSLLGFTLLIGVGATAVTFGLPKLVSFLFPPEQTGLPSSIYLVGSTLGTAVVFGAGRSTIGPWLGGWRPLFFWSGVVAIAFAAVWFVVASLASIDDQTADEDSSFSVASIGDDLRLVLSHRELQLIVVIGTMYLLVNHGIQGWLPTFMESRGVSADLAGQTASLYVVFFAAGTFAVPVVADRFGARRAALATCGGAIILGVGGIVFGDLSLLLFVGIVVTGLGVGGISPLVRAMPPELDGIGAKHTGMAVGFIFAIGEIGGFLGPLLIGYLHGITNSFVPGLTVLGGAGLVVVLTAGSMHRSHG